MSSLTTALTTLWSPARALGQARDGRRFAWALALSTAASLAVAGASAARLDYDRGAAAKVDSGESAAKMTPHEREEAIASAVKVSRLGTVLSGGLGPAASVLAAAFFLWLALIVAGGKPGFAATFAITAHAFLPLALRDLLTLPALLRHEGLTPQDLPGLLPSNLGAWLVDPAAPLGPRASLLGALDLFSLWALALLAVGLAPAARVSSLRSSTAVAVMWAAWLAVFAVALPSMTASGGAP
jgi:hypothetical protein